MQNSWTDVYFCINRSSLYHYRLLEMPVGLSQNPQPSTSRLIIHNETINHIQKWYTVNCRMAGKKNQCSFNDGVWWLPQDPWYSVTTQSMTEDMNAVRWKGRAGVHISYLSALAMNMSCCWPILRPQPQHMAIN